MLNTGPAKSPKQIKHFIARGVRTFVAESLNQVRWLNEQANAQQCQLQVLLRVQLRWPEGDKNPLGGDSLTPFGLGCDEWQSLNTKDYTALSFDGLHIFQWGNMLSSDKLADLWSQMITPLTVLANNLNINLNILDLGGGLGIPYSQWKRTGKKIKFKVSIPAGCTATIVLPQETKKVNGGSYTFTLNTVDLE